MDRRPHDLTALDASGWKRLRWGEPSRGKPSPQHPIQGGLPGGSFRNLPVPPPPPGGHPTACDRIGTAGDRYNGMVDYSTVKLGTQQLTHGALRNGR